MRHVPEREVSMKIKITIIAIAAVLLGGILFNVTREEKIKYIAIERHKQ